jgi:FKBP-type peptidyl-prolyl cis-trans isomerase 2
MQKAAYYLIAFLLLSAIVVGGAWYIAFGTSEEEDMSNVAENGDSVDVWYYGYFVEGGTKLVFDTNIEEVAKDNVTYPKALTFKYPQKFEPLSFLIGQRRMLAAFEDGIIGMREGESKLIVVPADEGYPYNESKVKTLSLAGTVPVYQEVPYDEYVNRTGLDPRIGEVNHDKVYGWDVKVLDFTEETVLIENLPEAGGIYYPYHNFTDFAVYVEDISGGEIRYVYQSSVGILLPDGGRVTAVNPDDNTLTVDYNPEVAGKTLYFFVILEKVTKV